MINKPNPIKSILGISIAEALVSAGIAGVLASWAFPAYQNNVSNKEMNTVRNELITVLNTGRSEAVLKRTYVTICPREGPGAMTCGGASHWSNGWLLFLDPDRNGAFNPSGSELLLASEPVIEGIQLNYPVEKVVFNRHGFAQGDLGAFVFCDSRNEEYLRGLIIATTGSVRMAQDSAKDKDFIPEDAAGVNLSCSKTL